MKRKWICPLMALVLVAGLGIMHPIVSGAAEEIDLTKECTLTVYPDNGNFGEDLSSADVVVDLYQVADAVKTQGYDTYSYAFREGYEALALGEEPDTEEWAALAGEAARIALAGEAPVKEGAGCGEQLEGLTPGLYLVIARGRGIEDYQITLEDEEGDGEGHLATIARSARHLYTFRPVLVSLPMKDPVLEEGQPVYNTANPGEWSYQWEVTLKPGQSPRYGSLEIVKSLLSYETKEPAAFVFQIEAVLDGVSVYSDVETLLFTGAGEERILLENKFPAGAEVTVTELYGGAAYQAVGEGEFRITVAADETASVRFVNDYEEHRRGGHGINNHFEYSDENGWRHTPVRAELKEEES